MSQEKIYICIIGRIGSGKGTVIDLFKEELGVKGKYVSGHTFSDPMREILNILYLPLTRENYQKLSPIVRHTFDEAVFGNVMYHRAINDPAEVVVVDGIRWPKDIEGLNKLPNHYFVFVTAPAEIRYERVKKRANRPGDAERTFEEFMEQEKAETERQIEEVGQKADIIIDNAGTYEDLRKKIQDIVKEKLHL